MNGDNVSLREGSKINKKNRKDSQKEGRRERERSADLFIAIGKGPKLAFG